MKKFSRWRIAILTLVALTFSTLIANVPAQAVTGSFTLQGRWQQEGREDYVVNVADDADGRTYGTQDFSGTGSCGKKQDDRVWFVNAVRTETQGKNTLYEGEVVVCRSDGSDVQNSYATFSVKDSGMEMVASGGRYQFKRLADPAYAYDSDQYKRFNSDLAALDNGQLVRHWAQNGIGEGRRTSLTFDIKYYKNNNNDLSSLTYAQLRGHFLRSGSTENRKTSPVFDANYYRSNNADLQGLSYRQVFEHYLSNGAAEGRRASADFDPTYYRSTNSDLQGLSNYALVQHYLENGIQEGRRGAA